MLIDSTLLIDEDKAITNPATLAGTNVIDLGATDALVQQFNERGELQILAQVTEGFTGSSNFTGSVQVSITNSDSSTMLSAVTVMQTAAVTQASLVQGYQFPLGSLPRLSKRYLSASYTSVGTFSAGKVFVTLVLNRQTNNA
jgi:hypothetical protein